MVFLERSGNPLVFFLAEFTGSLCPSHRKKVQAAASSEALLLGAGQGAAAVVVVVVGVVVGVVAVAVVVGVVVGVVAVAVVEALIVFLKLRRETPDEVCMFHKLTQCWEWYPLT